jgi:hypothetical protein
LELREFKKLRKEWDDQDFVWEVEGLAFRQFYFLPQRAQRERKESATLISFTYKVRNSLFFGEP